MKSEVSLGTFDKDQTIYFLSLLPKPTIEKSYFWEFVDYRYRELRLLPEFFVKGINDKYCIGYADTAAEVIRYSFGLYRTYEDAIQVLTDFKYSMIIAYSDNKLRRNHDNLEYWERHLHDVRARVYGSYTEAEEARDKLKGAKQ